MENRVDKLLASLNYNAEMTETIIDEYEEAVRKCDEDYLTSSRLWNEFDRKERHYLIEIEKLQKVVDQIDKEAALIGKISPIKTKLKEETLEKLNSLKEEYEMAKMGNNKAEAKALIAEYADRKKKLKEEGPQYDEYVEAGKKDIEELAKLYLEGKNAIESKEKEIYEAMDKANDAYVNKRLDEVLQRNIEAVESQKELTVLHSNYDNVIKKIEEYEYFEELVKPKVEELEAEQKAKMGAVKDSEPLQFKPAFSNESGPFLASNPDLEIPKIRPVITEPEQKPVYVMPDPDIKSARTIQEEINQAIFEEMENSKKKDNQNGGGTPDTPVIPEPEPTSVKKEPDVSGMLTPEEIDILLSGIGANSNKVGGNAGGGTPDTPVVPEPEPIMPEPIVPEPEPAVKDENEKNNNNNKGGGNGGGGTPTAPSKDEPQAKRDIPKPYFGTPRPTPKPASTDPEPTKPIFDGPIFRDEERFAKGYEWMNASNANNMGKLKDTVIDNTKQEKKHTVKEFFQARKEDLMKAKAKASAWIEKMRSYYPDLVGGRSL